MGGPKRGPAKRTSGVKTPWLIGSLIVRDESLTYLKAPIRQVGVHWVKYLRG